MEMNWIGSVLLICSTLLTLSLAAATIYVISQWDQTLSISIGTLMGLTVVLLLWTKLLTAFTDPGHLPRKEEMTSKANVHLNESYRDMYGIHERRSDLASYIHESPPVTARAIYQCYTCGTMKPTVSTAHCRECGRCVVGKDHHCVFLSTCIGVRNRAQFLAFLVTCTLALLFSVSIHIVDILQRLQSAHWPRVGPVISDFGPLEIGLVCGFGFLLVLKLVVFPFVFGYMANLQILGIIFVFGYATLGVLIGKHHLPWISAIVAYTECMILFFIGSSLYYQIKLLSEGSTIRELVSGERKSYDDDDQETRSSLMGDYSPRMTTTVKPMTPWELSKFALRGFLVSQEPRFMSTDSN